MYLRSLELQGFKSFPDKTRLEFNKGISAVVGPNGSGKSNISDAVKWVLGEKSNKSLRGEKMTDLIFSGSASRPKAAFAQVTLVLDNADRSLRNDSDLVEVSRKIYRSSGESEYMINGADVRHMDVMELFMDTGLGKDGYSVIGQGRIEDIISSKSTERRSIFEEAAGISGFRSRKNEAEQNLLKAEDNIDRLNDILSELQSRIGPLQKQCEKAKRFRELDDEKRRLEISVWVNRADKYLAAAQEYDEKLGLLDSQYSQISQELDKLENDIEDSFAESARKAEHIDSLKGEIHAVELENSQADASVAVLENDISHAKKDIERLRDEIEQTKNSGYFLEKEVQRLNERLDKANRDIEIVGEEIAAAEKSFDGLDSESDESDKELADANSLINDLYRKRSELSYRIENAKNVLSETQESLAAAAEDNSDAQSRVRLSQSELSNLKKAQEKNDSRRTELNNRLSGYNKLLDSRSAKFKQAADAFGENDIKLRETVQKLGLLRDLENSMESFAYSVKHIMNAAKQGRITGVRGLTAQLITVEPEYSVAIETAMGAALQNIVVQNDDTAKRCIRLLKESKAGRATFLPISSIKGQRLKEDLDGEDGFIAIASDLAECDEEYRDIAVYLLGRICIAEDIDSAARIAKKHGYKFRIVTLDGQVINAGGSFTGGSVSKTTGILTRKNEIKSLEKQRTSLEEENGRLKEQREKLSQEIAKLNADIEGVKEQLEECGREELRIQLETKRIEQFAQEQKSYLENTDQRLSGCRSRIEQAQQEIETAQRESKENDEEIVRRESELRSSQDRSEKLKERRGEISQKLSELKIKRVGYEKDAQSLRESIERLRNDLSDKSGDSGRFEENIAQREKDIEDKKREIENIRQRVKDSAGVIQGLKNRIAEGQREHQELDAAANRLRAEQKIRMEEKETLSNEINRVSERRKVCNADFDKLVSLMWDEYGLTRSEAAEAAQEIEDMSEAEKQLGSLKNKIKNLGSVNLGAIEEYAEVSEKYNFKKSQLDDVNESKMMLKQLIDDLTAKMKSMFTESFDKINQNFKEIFSELFGGGKGELRLADPDNVLECGIDILVQPPGKIINSLLSLSGGEKAFVAICIYFAILRVSPSPFCLLDEIEAALDDVNVQRYAQYLHRFTDRTQFITITHRRGTMEEADVLYGVTMQEKGISKLLKMELEDTKKMSLESAKQL